MPEFGRAVRSVGYGWSAVATRPTMRAGRDVREEAGTPSFAPASLFVALVLPMLPPIAPSLGTPLGIITIPIPIWSDWDGDDSSCGGSYVRQTWDGRHLDPPGDHLGKLEAPVEERHTGSFLCFIRFLRSCATLLLTKGGYAHSVPRLWW